MPKKEYSVELLRLLEILKTKKPTQLQNKLFKELNQEEREVYMAALKKKSRSDRKLLNKLNPKTSYRKGQSK